MKAIVTGAAGFIGSRLSRRLVDAGCDVVGIDAFTDHYPPDHKRGNVSALVGHPRFTLVEADLRGDGWQHHLDAAEAVFHHAGQPGVRTSWDGFDVHVAHNVTATHRLLDAVRRRPLTRFVYASSSSVYGRVPSGSASETTLPAPVSPYGVTKLAGEQLCRTYAEQFGVPVLALRYFTVYGAGQRPDMGLYRIIDAALHGEPFTRFGDGSQRRDLTHVEDVVAANLAALDAYASPGTVCNIAGGVSLTLNALITQVASVIGSEVPIVGGPAQAGDVARTRADTSRARELLGWRPEITLAEGVAEQVAWQTSRRITSRRSPGRSREASSR